MHNQGKENAHGFFEARCELTLIFCKKIEREEI